MRPSRVVELLWAAAPEKLPLVLAEFAEVALAATNLSDPVLCYAVQLTKEAGEQNLALTRAQLEQIQGIAVQVRRRAPRKPLLSPYRQAAEDAVKDAIWAAVWRVGHEDGAETPEEMWSYAISCARHAERAAAPDPRAVARMAEIGMAAVLDIPVLQ